MMTCRLAGMLVRQRVRPPCLSGPSIRDRHARPLLACQSLAYQPARLGRLHIADSWRRSACPGRSGLVGLTRAGALQEF